MGRPKKLVENNDGGVATEIEEVPEDNKRKLDEVLPNDEAGDAREFSGEDTVLENAKADINEVRFPQMEDIDWTDKIMSLFEPDELDNGYPKANGLRRLIRVAHGPVIESYPNTVQVPTPENMMRATVEYTVVVLKNKNLAPGEMPYTMKFADVADAYIDNVKGDVFIIFPTAIASTRAEVRALRKALNIGVAAAEELPDPSFMSSAAGKIPASLITKIDIKSSTLNVNVMKFINKGRGKPGQPDLFLDVEDIPFAVGQRLYKELNDFQQMVSAGKSKHEVVPEKFQGYDVNWRA